MAATTTKVASRKGVTSVPEKASEKAFEMSDAHKEALAEGREQSRVVRDYLTVLSGHRPKRGRKRPLESIRERLTEIDNTISDESDPLKRLEMISERERLEFELTNRENTQTLSDLEEKFVEIAALYSRRKGISYRAWREAGIPTDVLKRAGISSRVE